MTKAEEEFAIYAWRMMHFINLWTLHHDLLKKRRDAGDVGSVEAWPPSIEITVMLIVYAYFYSLVEDSDESTNAFRIWRERYPEEEVAIAAVEALVIPFRPSLKLYRNRLGFHGSRTAAHEAKGFELFDKHSGTDVFNAIKQFVSLSAALFAKSSAASGSGSHSSAKAREWLDTIARGERYEHKRNNKPTQ